jgi:hypothetical protein
MELSGSRLLIHRLGLLCLRELSNELAPHPRVAPPFSHHQFPRSQPRAALGSCPSRDASHSLCALSVSAFALAGARGANAHHHITRWLKACDVTTDVDLAKLSCREHAANMFKTGLIAHHLGQLSSCLVLPHACWSIRMCHTPSLKQNTFHLGTRLRAKIHC